MRMERYGAPALRWCHGQSAALPHPLTPMPRDRSIVVMEPGLLPFGDSLPAKARYPRTPVGFLADLDLAVHPASHEGPASLSDAGMDFS
jgi:hypothetical protein